MLNTISERLPAPTEEATRTMAVMRRLSERLGLTAENGQKLQAYFRKNDLDEHDAQAWDAAKLLDLGDFVSVTGPPFRI